MPSIDTPLLIVGPGPAALVAAKTASGRGLPSLVVDHRPIDAGPPVVLGPEAQAAIEPHGVLDVLRPYSTSQHPFTIAPLPFEQGLKHHCIADVLITIFDDMRFEPSLSDPPIAGTLTDGAQEWAVTADDLIDVTRLPTSLDAAIVAGADAANRLVDRLVAERGP